MSRTVTRAALRRLGLYCSAAALLAGAPLAAPAAATVQNGKIAFVSYRDGDGTYGQVYTMNADGTAQTRLMNTPSADDWDPAWSPDGTRIAFSSSRVGNQHDIYVINADGSGLTRLTTAAVDDLHPSWSPNGTRITFHSLRGCCSDYEIYVMNSDGSGETRLTNISSHDNFPAWSPDGTKIAFTSDRTGNKEIYTMNTDGTSQTRLTDDSGDDDYAVWSPSGSQIAFFNDPTAGGGDCDGNCDIYKMNADGSSRTRLTTNAWNEYFPAWSPDGTKIAYSSDPTGSNFEIYTMNTDGSAKTALTSVAGADLVPNWQAVQTSSGGGDSGTGSGGGSGAAPTPAKPASPRTPTPTSLRFTDSILDTSKTPYISRSTMFKYLRQGFSGTATATSRVEAYLVRVVKAKATRKGKKAAVTSKERCYKAHRPARRIACNVMTTNGVALSATSTTTFLQFKPLGTGARAKRALKALGRGKRLRKGTYRLTFKAYATLGGDAQAYTFNLRVA